MPVFEVCSTSDGRLSVSNLLVPMNAFYPVGVFFSRVLVVSSPLCRPLGCRQTYLEPILHHTRRGRCARRG